MEAADVLGWTELAEYVGGPHGTLSLFQVRLIHGADERAAELSSMLGALIVARLSRLELFADISCRW